MTLLAAAQGMINATTPLPWLVVSGQPSPAQLASLHAAGVRTVIDIRDPMEPRPFDEPAEVVRLGVRYVNVPVVSGALTEITMDRILGALRDASGTPTLLHCASGNRTGGPLLAYLMIDEKLPEAEAIDAAMRAGLRSAELLEWGTSYANSRG